MKAKKLIGQSATHIVLIFMASACLLPFLSMVSTSFMEVRGVLPDDPIIFPDFPLFLENYVKVWTANNFSRYFLNTLLLSFMGLAVNLVVSISMAYGFSRFRFPGREIIFNISLLTMMVPSMLAIIPQYTVVNAFRQVDHYLGVLMIWSGTCVAGNTFFYRGFFSAVPKELEESMFLDGAGRLQVLIHIVLPLTRPAIGTQAVFAFNGYWGDLFTVLTLIKTEEKRTLSVALQLFRGQYMTEFGLMFAASTIVIIPVILIFVVFQKQFMRQGLTEGAVKG